MDLMLPTLWTRNHAVVVCRGRLIHGESLTQLQRSVREALPAGRWVVVDLSQVSYMDAAGLGTLALIVVEGRVANGRLRMTPPSPRVRTLLRMTRLEFQIAWASPSVTAALDVA
jgi:anti-anti-sigma factor